MNPTTTSADSYPALPAPPEQGTPPSTRLSDPARAQQICWQLEEENRPREQVWARFEGMVDGNPPYPPSLMKQNGRAWETNISTLEGESLLGSAQVPYYDLTSAGLTLVDVVVDDPAVNPQERTHWQGVLTKEFDRLLKLFPAFDDAMQQLHFSFVGFGKGFLYWENEWDWMPQTKLYKEILLPKGCSTRPDKWELFVLRVDYPISTLWQMVKDEQSGKRVGWNVPYTRLALSRAIPRSEGSRFDTLAVQNELRNYDIYASVGSPLVQTFHVFAREFDGTWTHGILLSKEQAADTTGKRERPEWLYHRVSRFDNIRQILAPFYFAVRHGEVHGINGLMKQIYSICKVKDRLTCKVIDNGFMRMSIALQARTADAKAKSGIVMIGGTTVLPPGFDVQAGSIFADMDTGIALDRHLSSTISRNTGVYRPQLDQPTGNPRTATEIGYQYSVSATLSNSAVNRYYNYLDWAYREMYRRAAHTGAGKGEMQEAAREFIARCKAQGVPEQILRKAIARAHRAVGMGSASTRQQGYNNVLAVATSFPESGKTSFLRDFVGAHLDYQKAQEYMAEESRPDQGMWEATVENTQLQQGAPAVVTGTQNHVQHLTVHAGAGSAALQAVEKGAPPQTTFLFLQGLLPHMQEHLAPLGADKLRKPQFQQFSAVYKELLAAYNKLAQTIEQMQQEEQRQQAQAQQLTVDQQLKAAKLQSDTQLKAAKTSATMQMKEEQHNQQLRQSEESHQMELAQTAQQMAQAAQKEKQP